MAFTVATYGALCCNKGARRGGVDCKAQVPAPELRLSSGNAAPSELQTGKRKPLQKLQIQPQSVQLQKSRSSSENSNSTFKPARQRLTFALLEEDVDAAIDAVSECVLEASACVPAGS